MQPPQFGESKNLRLLTKPAPQIKYEKIEIARGAVNKTEDYYNKEPQECGKGPGSYGKILSCAVKEIHGAPPGLSARKRICVIV